LETYATNYAKAEVDKTANDLIKADLIPRLMIDCSHGNSMKDYHRQRDVLHDIALQIERGSTSICGIMLESFLIAGNQQLNPNKHLVYGQSITDGCLNWKDSLNLLEKIALSVHRRSLINN
jgi:3-deoxy-7-phosphoheptulonate synthase